MVDRCAVCGDPVPEGRQICPICEDIKARGKNYDQCVVADSGNIRRSILRDFIARCRKRRKRQGR